MEDNILSECFEAALQLQELLDDLSEKLKKCSDDATKLICLILNNHSDVL